MTKINRITIHGFKSFAHKTHVPLDDSYNCILGPNGSGKSNIGDAICFVLGRLSAKSMRAEKAANLIFNGGKKKQPSSSAYVEIAFDNASKVFPVEGKEVIINRTIKKTGSSIYKINGKKHTRTEILDLLGLAKINPEGYNIILQGDIMKFVDMPAVERRKVVEEISDVAVYEEKKHKAILELNKVEDQLNNAEIILKERKVYLRELKKDRDQALKFKELKDSMNSNKATYLHLQITEKEKVKAKYDAEINQQQVKVDSSESKIVQLKQKLEEDKENIAQINKKIEQKGEKEQLKVHREIEDLKVSLAENKTRVSTLKDEINKIAQRKDQFAQELKEIENKSSSSLQENKQRSLEIKRNQSQLKELEQQIAQFKKKHKIETSQELDQEIESKDKLIEQKQEEVQKIRQEQQNLLREKDKLEYQLQTLDERMEKVKSVSKENQEQIKQLQQLKTNFKSATLRLNQCLDQDSSFASQLANARKNLSETQEEQAKLNARTRSIQEGFSGNQAVQAIIKNKKKFTGVKGTVAELGQVKKKFSLALERAAGGKMQNIIVDSDKTAADCINYLKSNKLGSAAFIPLNKIKYRDISSEDQKLLKLNGVEDFALNLVSYQPQYKKAFGYVFGNSLVVEDINVARKVGVGRIKMATLDGNTVESSGVMRGGFFSKGSIGFKEKDSLDKLDKLEHEIGQLEGVLHNVAAKRGANEEEISTLRNHKAELEAEMIKLEKTLHLDTGDLEATQSLKKELQTNLKQVDTCLEQIKKNVFNINRELAEIKSKKQILRTQVNELRNPRLLAQLSAYEESKQQTREELLKLEANLKNSQSQVDQLFLPEKEKILAILKQHQKEEKQFKTEIDTLTSAVRKKDKELLQKEEDSKAFYSKYKELFNQREKFSQEVSKAENQIEQFRDKSRGSEREINLVSLKNAEVKARLAGLNEEYAKYKDAPLLKNKTIEELHKEISKYEVMLGQMSAVNMKALEVYEQVETEFNKLMDKKDSLEKEKIDVHTLMNEIETKKKDHFMKTFNSANEYFQKIFSSLFKKGKAYLQLNNPQNPFEDGVSIKVKITGKRFMDIKSLSGGEKTLTALSFIFAIQEYQPASFYILDEIDAALDKHNSETLAKLIRNYTGNAQYILISHNDALISEADTLFGVSMHEGVSKVTSLKI
ncbi:MAG: chromosome segregation protein SMC [Nanoarchaeota archaeon]|nr:chromosome segregation protein SMC [Nanoarchaeota archaeon]MBU1622766.1 chromosome segregation protein SMC [Nanoarchaeota archaeon]